jgi:hypothetical protein
LYLWTTAVEDMKIVVVEDMKIAAMVVEIVVMESMEIIVNMYLGLIKFELPS